MIPIMKITDAKTHDPTCVRLNDHYQRLLDDLEYVYPQTTSAIIRLAIANLHSIKAMPTRTLAISKLKALDPTLGKSEIKSLSIKDIIDRIDKLIS
jgi:hypothetical protein